MVYGQIVQRQIVNDKWLSEKLVNRQKDDDTHMVHGQ